MHDKFGVQQSVPKIIVLEEYISSMTHSRVAEEEESRGKKGGGGGKTTTMATTTTTVAIRREEDGELEDSLPNL